MDREGLLPGRTEIPEHWMRQMSMNVKQPGCLILATILLVMANQPGLSQQAPAAQTNEPPAIQHELLGGPFFG